VVDRGSQGIMMDARRTQEQADARAGELQEALQEMIAADRKRIASIDAQRETLAARENDLRTVEVRPATLPSLSCPHEPHMDGSGRVWCSSVSKEAGAITATHQVQAVCNWLTSRK
jgi:uncharacterized damage-inducible protein DinB